MRHRTAASLLALGLGLVEASSSSFAATPRPAPGPAERSPAPTNAGVTADAAQPEEVNVASSARGATAAGAGGGTSDLLALIDESNGTAAALTPDQKTGNSVTTINLADTTDVTRVALEVGDQRGQLRVYAVDAGAATDFRVALDSAKLVSSFSLDGSRNTVTADLGNTPVKTLALVWVPDTPGTSLSVSNVGVFTRTPPPAAAIGSGTGSAPVPTIATAAIGQSTPAPTALPNAASAAASTSNATSSAASTTATPRTPPATPPSANNSVPPVVPPQSRNVSF